MRKKPRLIIGDRKYQLRFESVNLTLDWKDQKHQFDIYGKTHD